VAFERRLEAKTILIVVPRFISRVAFPPLGECWRNTVFTPTSAEKWSNLFTGREHPSSSALPLAEILAKFPVAVLVDA